MQVGSRPCPCLTRPDRYYSGVKSSLLPLAATLVLAFLPHGTASAQDLEARLASIEKRLAALEAQAGGNTEPQRMGGALDAAAAVEKNKLAARERASKDTENYDVDQRREIETLYQVANKNWRSPEAVESLEKLIAKYDKANRTGCATLYLGQMSQGEQRLKYLNRAVKDFSDCYYFNGCQVGGYARLVLADTLMKVDKKNEAMKLVAELRKDYATATDHGGRLMVAVLDTIPWAKQ